MGMSIMRYDLRGMARLGLSGSDLAEWRVCRANAESEAGSSFISRADDMDHFACMVVVRPIYSATHVAVDLISSLCILRVRVFSIVRTGVSRVCAAARLSVHWRYSSSFSFQLRLLFTPCYSSSGGIILSILDALAFCRRYRIQSTYGKCGNS